MPNHYFLLLVSVGCWASSSLSPSHRKDPEHLSFLLLVLSWVLPVTISSYSISQPLARRNGRGNRLGGQQVDWFLEEETGGTNRGPPSTA